MIIYRWRIKQTGKGIGYFISPFVLDIGAEVSKERGNGEKNFIECLARNKYLFATIKLKLISKAA